MTRSAQALHWIQPGRRLIRTTIRRVAVLVFAIVLLGGQPGHAWDRTTIVDQVPNQADRSLQRVLDDIAQSEDGVAGIAVKHLWTGQTAIVNGSRVFEAASLYKLAVMVELFRQRVEGQIALDDAFIVADILGYDDNDEPIYGASYRYLIGEALYDMITLSDNDAAQLLLYRLGPDRINKTMAAIGLPDTNVEYDTATTPQDMLTLFDLLATGRAVDRDSSRAMIDILLGQQINDRIPAALPRGIPVAHKTGNLPGLIHDAGIIYADTGPYILVVLTDEFLDAGDAAELIRRVTRIVHSYFAERAAKFDRGLVP